MARSLKNVIETGRKGGGYVFMDSSGSIPENVPKETFEYYMNLSKELRAKMTLMNHAPKSPDVRV